MEAPSTGPAGHPGRSAVDFGQLLTGVELEVIIHGDVGGQHLQVQSVRVLQKAGGCSQQGPWGTPRGKLFLIPQMGTKTVVVSSQGALKILLGCGPLPQNQAALV